jgi:hypothetical protein
MNMCSHYYETVNKNYRGFKRSLLSFLQESL